MNLRWRVAQFFEIRWWQRYLSGHDKTAYLAWKRRYWFDFLKKSGLEIPPGASVLDAGCGPAGIFIILGSQTVDALDSLLDRYEKHLPHFCYSDYPNVRFFSQPLETFGSTIDSGCLTIGSTAFTPSRLRAFTPEFCPKSAINGLDPDGVNAVLPIKATCDTASLYDFLFCLNALNHVADLPLCLDRLAALTKPGGILAVSIDAHNHTWLKRLFRLVPADILHPHQYDLEEYRAMLAARGFQIEKSVLIKKGLVFNYCLLLATKDEI